MGRNYRVSASRNDGGCMGKYVAHVTMPGRDHENVATGLRQAERRQAFVQQRG